MGRPHRSKVTLIERRDLWLPQALGQCDDAGIDDAEREVGISRLQLAAAGKVGARWRFDAVNPRQQIVQKDEPRLLREPAAAPVVELGKDEGWDHEVLVRIRQQPRAAVVIWISGIERGEQRTGIAD